LKDTEAPSFDPVFIPEHPEWFDRFEHGLQDNHKKPLPYRLFIPEGAGPDTRLPLVIYYHGVRGRGDDNELQMKSGNRFGPAYFSSTEVQSQFPCFVLVPQCPREKYWVNFTRGASSKQLRRSKLLIEAILAQHAIDPDRVYVTGQSMGGFATWAMLQEYPDQFAAGLAISGGGNPRRARAKLIAPVWAWHGTADPLVGVWRGRQMAEVLERAKKPHRYTEIPDGRHDIWSRVFATMEVAEWLFQHRRGAQ
jgi:predicted peptidase